MKKILFPVILLLFSLNASAADNSFNSMVNDKLKRTVPLINVKQLSEKIRLNKQIYILDTREPDEYNVSHIRNSIPAGFNGFTIDAIKIIPKNAEVVVYCSIGYRSEIIGEKMTEAGYTKVYNLFGGIFDWVNNGFPIYDNNNNKTDKIHAYSRRWGKWLTRGEKVYN